MVDTSVQPNQATDPDSPVPSPRLRLWTLTVACLGVLLVISSMIALNTALAPIALDTSATQTQLTWIVDAYTLAMACLLLPAGAIGDRYGRRGAMVFGLVVFALASAVPTVWTDPTTLIIARAAAGVGAAFIFPATLSLITAAYPAEQRTKAVGIWAGVAGSGAVFGMLGTGVLLHFWSWPSIFWGFTLAAVALIALSLTVASSRDDERKPLDWLGAVLIGTAVALFVFGMLEAPSHGWGHPLVWGCLVAGVALAVSFGSVELRQTHPLLDIRLFANPTFSTGAAGITVFFVAMFGYFFVSMQFIQMVLGYNPIQTAFALVPLVGPMLILSALSFWYLPKLGLRLVVFVGLMLVALGFYCMTFLEIDSPYWDLAWPLLILSTGVGFCTAPTTSAIMTSVPDGKQGVASAVNDTTREIGAALGIAFTGSLLASTYTDSLAPQLTSFPDEVQAGAVRSLGEALGIAERMGPAGQQLADLSKQAFLEASHTSSIALTVVLATSAVLIGLWAPGRDGRQLAVVRRIISRK